jgi:hypothetical protein
VVNHLEVAELDEIELDPAPDELAHVGGHVRAPEAHLRVVGQIGRRAPVDQKRRGVPTLEQDYSLSVGKAEADPWAPP